MILTTKELAALCEDVATLANQNHPDMGAFTTRKGKGVVCERRDGTLYVCDIVGTTHPNVTVVLMLCNMTNFVYPTFKDVRCDEVALAECILNEFVLYVDLREQVRRAPATV